MSLAVANQSHSILKSHKDFASSSGRPLRVVSFETIDVAPITEKYRNDLINNSRQRDINAYHKMSNPYYLAPSFNKPFLNHDFKTPKYTKVPNANTFLVLVKLHLADNHQHPSLHVHSHGHGHGNQQNSIIDELSLLSLKYTVSQLAKSNDQIYVLSVINKFDLKYHEKGYYLTSTEIQKYKNLLDTQIVPLLQSAIMPAPQQQDGKKEFLLSMNLIFDQNVSLSIENTILDFSPNVVILSHYEKNLDSDQENGSSSGGTSSTRGRTARLLMLKIANHSPITNYCMKKLSCPIVVYTSNNAVRHYRVEDERLISSFTIDEQLAGSTTSDLSETGPKTTSTITTTTSAASSSFSSVNANSNDSENNNSSPPIKEDFFINLLKSVPVAGTSSPSSRSSSQSRSHSRSQSRSISRSMSRSVSRSRSRQRNANATTSPTSPTINSRSDSRSSSLLHRHRSLSPLASMSSLRPSRSAQQQQRLSPYKSNESLSSSLSKNLNGHSNANGNSNAGFSGLTPYRSADTALLQASRKRATAEKESFDNGSSGREKGIFGGRRISSVAEENPAVDDIREKLKKRVSTFSRFKQKLSSSSSR